MEHQAGIAIQKDELSEWFVDRPKWIQTAAARLAATRKMPTEDEIRQLADLCIAEGNHAAGTVFETMPAGVFGTTPDVDTFKLRKLDKVVGVNAIRHNAHLDFGESNLSVIFGMNGAGKSGYARLLKHVCGARNKPELLPDVFNAAEAGPSCDVVVATAAGLSTLEWTTETGGLRALRSVHIFDTAVADSYVDLKNEASYEPRRMRFLSALIQICDMVASDLAVRKAALPSRFPNLPPDLSGTTTAAFVTKLSNATPLAAIDAASELTAADTDLIREMEVALKKHDVGERIKRLDQDKRRLELLRQSYESIKFGISDAEVEKIVAARTDSVKKRKAATEDANKVFAGVALEGIGGASWSLLWEQARKYSEGIAYPETPFPATEEGKLCVLCLQPLDADACSRMSDFEAFVKAGLEAAATKAEETYSNAVATLPKLPDREKWDLDLEFLKMSPEISSSTYDALAARLSAIPKADGTVPVPIIDLAAVDEAIASTSDALAKEKGTLEELAKEDKKAELEKTLRELKAREWLSQQKQAVVDEVARLAAVKRLTNAEGLTKTNALTTKKNELAKDELAHGYRDRFLAELKVLGGSRLKVEPVPIPEGKGKVSFKLAIKGAVVNTNAGNVLSEGESRIVALSAFLADITGSGQPTPFIFDDPVSSLDQEFEERVVERLVELAKTRQVIVFTHRLSLLALIEEAAGKTVQLSITTLRRIGPSVGLVDILDVRHAKPDKGFIAIRDHKLPQIRKHSDAGDAASYDAVLKAACGDFRILIERTVEKILLNGLVERFRRSVQTQQIKTLAKVTAEDCAMVEEMMTKYSKFEHSQSDELPGVLPTIDELSLDLDTVIAWIDGFKKRA